MDKFRTPLEKELSEMGLENLMLDKCKAAQRYLEVIKKQILTDHNYEY